MTGESGTSPDLRMEMYVFIDTEIYLRSPRVRGLFLLRGPARYILGPESYHPSVN
jgi:hypothetical protein